VCQTQAPFSQTITAALSVGRPFTYTHVCNKHQCCYHSIFTLLSLFWNEKKMWGTTFWATFVYICMYINEFFFWLNLLFLFHAIYWMKFMVPFPSLCAYCTVTLDDILFSVYTCPCQYIPLWLVIDLCVYISDTQPYQTFFKCMGPLSLERGLVYTPIIKLREYRNT
jgi:hypothetical protein